MITLFDYIHQGDRGRNEVVCQPPCPAQDHFIPRAKAIHRYCGWVRGERPQTGRGYRGTLKEFFGELDVLPDFTDCCFHNGDGAKIATGDCDKLGPKRPPSVAFIEGLHDCHGVAARARLWRAAVMRPGMVADVNRFELFLFSVHILFSWSCSVSAPGAGVLSGLGIKFSELLSLHRVRLM